MMEAIVERCCGLDVHQATVVACVLVGDAAGRPRKEVRTFKTFTQELLRLRDWLQEQGVTDVGMESTGVYWKPVYAVLEDHFRMVVGNAQHIKNVPGRKTDVKDSEWIARLVRHGLIRPSFVPPKPLRELRDLLRYRRKLLQSRTAERNRLLKLLETANVKVSSVASNVFGVSGMAMLRALVEGQTSAAALAELAKGQLRKKLPELALALEGRVEEHHRFMLRLQLRRLDDLDRDIEEMDQRIDDKLEPYRDAHQRLMQIPGVSQVTAAVLIAEIGTDMSVFPTEQHLASWAGVSPGNNESAGKRGYERVTKGNAALKTALVEAAHAAGRAKGTYLKDKFHRLKARRGVKRAALAVGHKILISAYHMLKNNVPYTELGEAYLDRLDRHRTVDRLKRRLERLGYEVALLPTGAPPLGPVVPAEAFGEGVS
jgi:transposase